MREDEETDYDEEFAEVYDDQGREELVQADEISPEEEAFMAGYEEAVEEKKEEDEEDKEKEKEKEGEPGVIKEETHKKLIKNSRIKAKRKEMKKPPKKVKKKPKKTKKKKIQRKPKKTKKKTAKKGKTKKKR